jgi:hypothetical protein
MPAKLKRQAAEAAAFDPRVVDELRAIKNLMLLLLVKLDSDPDEIGMALGLTASRVRDLISVRKVSRIARSEKSGD